MGGSANSSDMSERDILYKVLFEMKKDLNDVKKVVHDIVHHGQVSVSSDDLKIVDRFYEEEILHPVISNQNEVNIHQPVIVKEQANGYSQPIVVEESLSLQDKEIDMIKKALAN